MLLHNYDGSTCLYLYYLVSVTNGLNRNPPPGGTQDFRPTVAFSFTQPNVSQFSPVHQPPADDVSTDPQVRLCAIEKVDS